MVRGNSGRQRAAADGREMASAVDGALNVWLTILIVREGNDNEQKCKIFPVGPLYLNDWRISFD